MRFDTSQQMKLGQQMKLAPRMIQSMEILQMPVAALQERIEQELASNVTLETFEPGVDKQAIEELRKERERDDREHERELKVDESSGEADFERLGSMEETYSEALENQYEASSLPNRLRDEWEPGRRAAANTGERDAKMDAMANTAARSASVADQLLEQWLFAPVDERTRALGKVLIEHVDDDGYVRTALASIADQAPQSVRPVGEDELEHALMALQLFVEPAGIGARNLRECLLLQVDAADEDDPSEDWTLTRRVIDEHLDDVLHNRVPKVAEALDRPLEQVKRAIEMMRRLRTSPGRELVQDTPPAIIPDAIVEYDDEQDRYIAYMTDGLLPNLRINRDYAEMLRDKESDKTTKDFLKRNLTNATWLIDALQQRKRTLQRVLNVVVDAQRDFFDLGPQALRPLPMTQVADQLGVHVATVSRAVSDKHVMTPRGVFPLRKFFTGGTQTDTGEEVSWDAIKAALKEVVDAEDKKKPLSDEALSKALGERGIEIARRTVAKYRDQLGIPSARMRRRY
ncbi:MAG: RNA polymerase factor sigma-54 [Phycisphaerales bacterium]